MIIVNNPNYLEKAISTPPGQRQTKLREDMTGELEYRTMCWSDEDVGDLEDDAQVASPSGEGNDNEITVKPVLSEPVFNGHPLLSGDLSKSRKSLPLITVNLTAIKRHSVNRVAQLLSTMSKSSEFKGV